MYDLSLLEQRDSEQAFSVRVEHAATHPTRGVDGTAEDTFGEEGFAGILHRFQVVAVGDEDLGEENVERVEALGVEPRPDGSFVLLEITGVEIKRPLLDWMMDDWVTFDAAQWCPHGEQGAFLNDLPEEDRRAIEIEGSLFIPHAIAIAEVAPAVIPESELLGALERWARSLPTVLGPSSTILYDPARCWVHNLDHPFNEGRAKECHLDREEVRKVLARGIGGKRMAGTEGELMILRMPAFEG